MTDKTQEYRWYLVGCDRLGYEPLSEPDFLTQWQALEDHAERLKVAQANDMLTELDLEQRTEMQQRMKADPFIKAILVGMSEETSTVE